VSTKIYVEGGGDQKRTLQACRIAFSKYFDKVVPGARPRVVACGAREKAYQDFANGLNDPDYDRVLLLVDSEVPVSGEDDAWTHLNKRDGWNQPQGAANDAAHMMVQCMESWFVADKDCLENFYQDGFKPGALPARKEIELISKADVSAGLENATRHTKKGRYHKTRHGFDLLGRIDPNKVAAVSPYCDRLHKNVQR
jgi:hypothetical protein